VKTYYTIPAISSLNDNKVDLLENRLEELRVLRLKGDFVRLRVDKNYIECDSYVDVDLSKYKKIFENISQFFYGIGYLFGCVDNGELVIYDIYTNENYFSSRDLKRVSELTGLPIAEPLVEGRIEIKKILNEFSKEDLYILPSVYIDIPKVVPKTVSKIVFGKEPTYNYYTPPVTTSVSNVNVVQPEVLSPNKKEIFILTTKEERTAIFNETYKNVSKYVEDHKKVLSKEDLDWWKKNGKYITYLYSIHTLPSTRQLIWDFIDFECNYCLDETESLFVLDAEQFSWILVDFFWDQYQDIIPRKIELEADFSIYFYNCFKEELEILFSFYEKESLINLGAKNVQY